MKGYSPKQLLKGTPAGSLILGTLISGLVMVQTVSCSRGVKWPATLEPALRDARGYDVRDACQVFEHEDFRVSVCPVGWEAAASRYRSGNLKNPFGEGTAAVSQLVFFSVELENRSLERLFFNPIWTSLFAGAAVPRPPLDVSDIYRINRDDPDVEKRALAFRRFSFDGTTSLAGGEKMERYLVFSPPKSSFREMTLVLQDLYLGSRDYDPAFLFLPVTAETE